MRIAASSVRQIRALTQKAIGYEQRPVGIGRVGCGAVIMLHTLLVLGIWDALAKAGKAPKEGSTAEE